MKIIAILAIMISVWKLIISLKAKPSDEVFQNTTIITPEQVYTVFCIALIGDGILELFCGLFILFTT